MSIPSKITPRNLKFPDGFFKQIYIFLGTFQHFIQVVLMQFHQKIFKKNMHFQKFIQTFTPVCTTSFFPIIPTIIPTQIYMKILFTVFREISSENPMEDSIDNC